MPKFIDVHTGMKGIDQKMLEEAHRQDLANESKEGVHFLHAWADPATGNVFCLSEGPSKEAVRRVHSTSGHSADQIYEVSLEVD